MPTEEDSRSDQKRIQDRLEKEGLHAVMSFYVMKKLYPLCEQAGWKVTVSLGWDGNCWKFCGYEEGDTIIPPYGYDEFGKLNSMTTIDLWRMSVNEKAV